MIIVKIQLGHPREWHYHPNPETGRPMRFADYDCAITHSDIREIKDNCIFEKESESMAMIEDVIESMELAMKPHIGKVLDRDIIKEIINTVGDAVDNNMEES